MDSLTEDQIKRLRKRFSKEFFKNPVSQSFMANKDFIHRFIEKYPNRDVLATPLVEVISIRISNHNANDVVPYQVHGTIKVTDGQGVMFTIYDRNSDIPETICNGDALTLVLPKGRPITITPSNVVTLDIHLWSRIGDRDEEIINEHHTWDYLTNDNFDKVKTDKINGVRALAFVDHVSYRHAVFASVYVMLFKKTDDKACDRARIYGSIVADYANRYSTVLFDKKQNDSVVVEYGKCIEISTHVVVVPVWSSFTIYVDLWNANTNQKFDDKTDKQSYDILMLHDLPYDVELRGQNEVMYVRVVWGHADLEQPTWQRKDIADQQTLMSLNRRGLPSCFNKVQSLEVWEVFSISVYSNSDEELNLWGSIDFNRVTGRGYYFTYFERKSPQRLLPNQTLPIRYPTSCIQCPAVMTLNLIGDNGHVISKGDITWEEQTFERCKSCLNRPLCSVVRGDDDYYATVHYTIFADALQATIKICLIDKTSCLKDTKVKGCVHAQYKEFTYRTPWENDLYRRKLFVGRVEDPSLEFSDSEIQLLESVIAVGVCFTLVIDMDLEVISHHDDSVLADKTFKQQLQFSPDMFHQEMKLESKAHQIVVSVEWSDLK